MNAQEMDKKIADEAFVLRMEEYAMADAKNLAQPHISSALRSDKWARDWNRSLAFIAAKSSALPKEMRTRIAELRIEASKRVRELKIVENGEAHSVNKQIHEIAGISLGEGRSLHEMTCLLLAHIYKLIKDEVEV